MIEDPFHSKAGEGDDYSNARVLVAKAQIPIRTEQLRGCGLEGDFIQMSKRFIQSYKKIPEPFDNDGMFILSSPRFSDDQKFSAIYLF